MGIGFGKSKYDFSEFIRGLQQAVNSAQELLEVQQLNSITKFFDENGIALAKEICTSNGKKVNVPIISLVPQNTLIMDEVEIEFDAKLEGINKAQMSSREFLTEVNNAQVQLGIVGKKDDGLVHVKVVFKSAEVPEGVCKLIDECNTQF